MLPSPIFESIHVSPHSCSIRKLTPLRLSHVPKAPVLAHPHCAQLLIFWTKVIVFRVGKPTEIRKERSPGPLLHASQLPAHAREGKDAVVVHVLQYLLPQLVRQHIFLFPCLYSFICNFSQVLIKKKLKLTDQREKLRGSFEAEENAGSRARTREGKERGRLLLIGCESY